MWNNDQKFRYFPPRPERKKGLYSSDIKINWMDQNNTEKI